jgi:hypothetical protein
MSQAISPGRRCRQIATNSVLRSRSAFSARTRNRMLSVVNQAWKIDIRQHPPRAFCPLRPPLSRGRALRETGKSCIAWMSDTFGSIASPWPRASHFRSTPNDGRRQTASACPKSAGNGLVRRSKWHRHSITSSARPRSVTGISRPRALAVLRLITNSNFVGCSTGMSAGFAPLRILPMKGTIWRCMAT